jgi:hypothetical protein
MQLKKRNVFHAACRQTDSLGAGIGRGGTPRRLDGPASFLATTKDSLLSELNLRVIARLRKVRQLVTQLFGSST